MLSAYGLFCKGQLYFVISLTFAYLTKSKDQSGLKDKPFHSAQDFEKIFKEYFAPLCNYINTYIHNWEESREIVQDTFTKIWNIREKVNVRTSVKSYLYQSAKNTMVDYIRKSSKMVVGGEDELPEHIENDEKALDPYLIRESILKAMDSLKPKNREIFSLNKLEGLTYTEIAKHLDISERAVEDNIARAIRLLREKLKNRTELQ